MTTLLVAAVLILCGMAVWGVKVIASAANPQSTPAYAFLGVSIALALKILLAMLQTEFSRRQITTEVRTATAEVVKTRHDLKGVMNTATLKVQEVATEFIQKTNGGLERAIAVAADKSREAEHDQLINDPEMMKKLAVELCPMLVKEIAAELRKGPPQPPAQT